MNQKPSLGVFYGLNEGPGQARRLYAAAKARGIAITEPEKADIVICHSGGCFFAPEAGRASVVILANPVCGHLKHVPLVLLQKIVSDFLIYMREHHFAAWAHKTACNIIYGVTRVRTNSRMLGLLKRYQDSLPECSAAQVAVINTRSDPWAKWLPQAAVEAAGAYRFLSLPGSHDDLWLHPERYLDIVQYMYGSDTSVLAQTDR